jgi:antitoxin component YwqK of YwqJK toxin-antitoxin module
MKNHIIISLLILLIGCSQPPKEYNQDDLNFDKNTNTFTIKFSDERPTGDCFQMMGNKKVIIGKIKYGLPQGKWTTWYKNGQKNEEITFKNGKEDGVHTVWLENGQKRSYGTYKDGKKDGVFNYYTILGSENLYSTKIWEDGVLISDQ